MFVQLEVGQNSHIVYGALPPENCREASSQVEIEPGVTRVRGSPSPLTCVEAVALGELSPSGDAESPEEDGASPEGEDAESPDEEETASEAEDAESPEGDDISDEGIGAPLGVDSEDMLDSELAPGDVEVVPGMGAGAAPSGASDGIAEDAEPEIAEEVDVAMLEPLDEAEPLMVELAIEDILLEAPLVPDGEP